MKRFLKYIPIIAVVLFSSCTKQEELDYQQGQDVEYIVTHVKEDNSKTSIDNHGYIYWSPNEAINVFYGSTSIKFRSLNKVKQASAVFAGTQPFFICENEESFLMPVMGLYPYDSQATCTDGTICTTFNDSQEAVDSSFADKSFPTIAQTTIDDYVLSFYNICGGLKFTVGKSGIKKVIISGNNGENIAGKIKVCFGENGVPAVTEVLEGKTEITLSSSSGLKVGTPYYIIVLPTVFSNGLKVRLETDDMYAEKIYEGKREIKRSVFADLSQVDSQLQWNKKPSTPLTFTSTGSTYIALKYISNDSPTVKLQYKKNNGNWETYDIGAEISLSDGELVSFQAANGGNSTFSSSYYDYYNFTMSGDGTIAASGNIMSLLDNTQNLTSVPNSCFFTLFEGCKLLTQAPELPATTLAESCYSGMFYNCSSLTQTSELPALVLAKYCYSCMFIGCSSLTQMSKLPATTLAEECYSSMFSRCSSLTQAPELPATTLAKRCYSSMFSRCSSLTQAPELPATTLAEECYNDMFYKCNSLVKAPKLPAINLAENCYRGMFYCCTSLTSAPDLPASALAPYCYPEMFYGCSSLTQAPELPATTLSSGCYESMFNSCSSLTQAPILPATTLAKNCYSYMFCCCDSLVKAPELPATTLDKYCYYGMFQGCKSLKQVTSLPATNLATGCCNSMFYNCTSLEYFQELPATTLAENCYSWMFYGCSSLIHAPELPATTLAENCYSRMFSGCSSLKEAPELPATTLAENCYSWMFYGCSSLTHAPELPTTTLTEGCYSFMFSNCVSLEQAPVLPATTLVNDSYKGMFTSCSKLKYVKCLAKYNIITASSTNLWLKNVSSSGTFVKANGIDWPSGASGIPSGWTIQVSN